MKTKDLSRTRPSGQKETGAPKNAGTVAGSGTVPLDLKTILVPIDFSPPSKRALAYAVPFARQFHATVTLLHVAEPIALPDFTKSFPLALETDKVTAGCKHELARIAREFELDAPLLQDMLVRHGRAYTEIAEAARALKSDLIIIATHGFTGLRHVLLGSVTERVVRHAPCPVLVVRESEHEFVAPRRVKGLRKVS